MPPHELSTLSGCGMWDVGCYSLLSLGSLPSTLSGCGMLSVTPLSPLGSLPGSSLLTLDSISQLITLQAP